MKVIIIGCTHAGLVAAEEILKFHNDTQITIYERNDNFSFLSDGIFLYLNGDVNKLSDIFSSSPQKLESKGIKVRAHHNVISVDAKGRYIRVVNMNDGKIAYDKYDKLIVTTGSLMRIPPIVGIDSQRVMLCKNYQQTKNLYHNVIINNKIAIIGGGYAGIEIAESLVKVGKKVSLFHDHKQLLNNRINKETSDWLLQLLKRNKIELHINCHVKSFENTDNSPISIHTRDGNYGADMAVICTGVIPNTRLFQGQLKMNRQGALITNKYMQTSNPNIYAAGDCTLTQFNPIHKASYIPLTTTAIRQGIVVAHNIFENSYPFLGAQATSAIQLFGYNLATTGLTIDHAIKLGLDAAEVTYRGPWRPNYMPHTEILNLYLVYDRDNRKILGAQLRGKDDLTQLVNIVSVAIQNNNTIDDLSMIDMFFQPNFSLPFNCLNIIAKMAIEQEIKFGNHKPRFTL